MRNKDFSHFGLLEEHQEYVDVRIEPSKEAMFDGYNFGSRLLEGVIFIAKIEEDTSISVRVSDDSKDYFEELNQKLWLGRALKFVLENDVFEDMETGDDVGLIKLDGTYNN
tara:strand:- start:1348 stop:1680 length:333 start_codon:yes stop_codon:yes gene_type:complete